jgi:hypothetical protein
MAGSRKVVGVHWARHADDEDGSARCPDELPQSLQDDHGKILAPTTRGGASARSQYAGNSRFHLAGFSIGLADFSIGPGSAQKIREPVPRSNREQARVWRIPAVRSPRDDIKTGILPAKRQ